MRGFRKFIALLAIGIAAGTVQAGASDLKIVLNQSPWFEGFRKTVEQYNAETGNTVTLDPVPYPSLLEKVRSSLRAPQGEYDITLLDVNWLAEIYSGGFLEPIDAISPGYKLPENVLDFDEVLYWDAERSVFNRDSGKLTTFPVTGNPQLFYYREDIYEEKGLTPPKTWDDLKANIAALSEEQPPYAFLTEGGRGDIVFRITPFLLQTGGGIFKNPREGDYAIILNSPETLRGLKFYIDIARAGYPNPGSLGQGELIQLFSTGKAAQADIVSAARGPITDPDSSVVGELTGVALIPHPSDGKPRFAAGHWAGGIAKNIPDEQKKAAVAFFSWLLEKDHQSQLFVNGGVPVRSDLSGSVEDPLDFLPVLAAAIKDAVLISPVKENAQINAIVGLYLNQALTGELTPEAALNKAAAEVYDLISKAGYKTAKLPDLG